MYPAFAFQARDAEGVQKVVQTKLMPCLKGHGDASLAVQGVRATQMRSSSVLN